MEADEERIKLEKLAEELATMEDDESQDYLMQVCFILLPLNNIFYLCNENLMNADWFCT